MSSPRFSDHLNCAHCGGVCPIELNEYDDREDYWVFDGEELTCLDCGLKSCVSVDHDEGVYVQDCEDDACEVCLAE